MPCIHVDYDEKSEFWKIQKKIALLEAFLCAVFSIMENENRLRQVINTDNSSFFDALCRTIDEKETGITGKQLRHWWENHKKRDARRCNIEKAKGKLTVKEKVLLGIK